MVARSGSCSRSDGSAPPWRRSAQRNLPVRCDSLLLADGEQSAGAIAATIQQEFGISQPGVSQHLRVLRENGFATVRAEGARRLYAADPEPLQEIDVWLDRYRRFWHQRLDALGTEIKRGRRAARRADDQ